MGSPVGFAVNIPSPVPEPATVALLLGGLGVVGWMARRCG
ncbi:MAG: PEP-CTERM sorting domain-containing protein [Rubrivivax sp.]